MASPLAIALMQAQAGSGRPQPNVAQVAPTNFTQANSDYNNAMEQSYAAKLQQQNAMWGGLAGLGSAGILVAPKLMGSAGAGGLTGNVAYGGSASAPLAGLDASDYGAGASLMDSYGLGTGATAAADAGTTAAADAGATAAAGGGGDALASLLSLLAFA